MYNAIDTLSTVYIIIIIAYSAGSLASLKDYRFKFTLCCDASCFALFTSFIFIRACTRFSQQGLFVLSYHSLW